MVSLSWYSLLAAWREGQMPIDSLFEFAADSGYDGVEILDAFLYPAGVDRNYALSRDEISRFCDTAKELMLRTGLVVSSIAVTNDFNFGDAGRLQVEHAKVRNGVSMAKALDAQRVRVFAGNPTDTDGIELTRYRCIEAFKQASEPGVILALENHGPTFCTPYRLNSILESVDPSKLGVCFDIGNFTLADYPLSEALSRLSNIQLIHAKDFVADEAGNYTSRMQNRYSGCRLGQGVVAIAETLARLPQDVPVVVELECGADGVEGSREARQWLANVL